MCSAAGLRKTISSFLVCVSQQEVERSKINICAHHSPSKLNCLGRAENLLRRRELDCMWQRREKGNLRPKYVPHFMAAQSAEEFLIPYITALRQATRFWAWLQDQSFLSLCSYFSFKGRSIFILEVWMLCLNICYYTAGLPGVFWRPEVGIWAPGTRVVDSCEPPCRGQELKSGILKE